MKDKAKGQLKGNWKWAVLVALINILVLAGLEYLGGKLGKSESIFSIFGVVLDLSFIGWEILASMTLGIGYLWLIPYMQTTKANFFHALAGKKYLR